VQDRSPTALRQPYSIAALSLCSGLPIPTIWQQAVLLHDEPSRETLQFGKDGVQPQVPSTEFAEDVAGPHLRQRRPARRQPAGRSETDVLEVHVRDPGGPLLEDDEGITATKHHVARVQAQADVGLFQESLGLLRGLHPGAHMRMEHRLISP
jgi:hypothetical protein